MSARKKQMAAFTRELPRNLFAGFVVSLVALPLGLGLALASDAPPISGLIAAVVGGMVVALLGGSHVTIAGPGNGLVIVILGAITTLGGGDLYQGYLFTLAAVVFAGGLMILLGFLKMGRLADFFPASAIQGMLAAIGIGILSKQFHIMIGHTQVSGSIVSLLGRIPSGLYQLFLADGAQVWIAAGIGVGSLMIMIFYGRIRNRVVQLIPAPMWILILTVGMSYVYQWLQEPYPLGADFLIRLPDSLASSFVFPDFSHAWDRDFFVAVFAITFIASIESLLSIKALDKLDPANRRSNVNRDLKALGLASVISGFLGGLAVVTVIARSSVNVNNGATNRSSNFLHAMLLLLFVLVFQEQLRRIPLSALAAILVYTGYKLATPGQFKEMARIGKEQLIIFLVTLATTLLTNLITGIAVGILTTFVFHVIVTRSIGLFLRNVFKPNVLLFREGEENYYASVKYFCNFLNFYRLKDKLDAVPENEELVLDFSLCEFVDDTVLESVENYSETFEKRGGHLELIGLDKHHTKSTHPFALRKLTQLSVLKPIEHFFTGRQRSLEQTAAEYDWVYRPERNTDTRFLRDFIFFRRRQLAYSYNELRNAAGDFRLMDIEFTEGIFTAREVVKATVLYIECDQELPVFTLDREGLLGFLYDLAGFRDIPLDDHPDFNRRFHLSGADPEPIAEMFSDELVLFLESNPYYHVESNGKGLLILKNERLLGIREIKRMRYFGQRLGEHFGMPVPGNKK
ncbi:SulP family inorganic anion transporter [Robiginitalea sp. SC105]|uniref:SulP family inorganic anion transporter n=1 Tax=Robiginitalea sp. SC105 TaxID=2762332 RepID=UPI00163ACCA0|nr:SulP family inorganic anion transporter [Robiginitalea sp. SC105]MBC2838178.1 SulP family inorganic anion transporter [Robiginitalea sp. SC105]